MFVHSLLWVLLLGGRATLLVHAGDRDGMKNNLISARKSSKPRRTVAVIGGGVSGLGAARRLSLSPEYEVTVLEAGPEPVPKQTRLDNNGNTLDLDIIYLPGISWTGYGTEERWSDLINLYGPTELIPANEYNTNLFMKDDGTLIPGDVTLPTEVLLSRLEELVRFIDDYQDYFATSQYKGVANCLASGFALAEETYEDWCTRNNFPYIQQTMAETFALFGNLPVASASACQVFGLFDNKAPASFAFRIFAIQAILSFRGIGPDQYGLTIPELAQEWIQGLQDEGLGTILFTYEGGYGSFFRRVAKQAALDYRTNSKVTSVEKLPSDDGIKITLESGSSLIFDEVIVATRPEQALSFIPPTHPMAPLFESVPNNFDFWVTQVGIYAVAFVQANVNQGIPLAQATSPGEYVIRLVDTLPPAAASDGVVQDTITPMHIAKQFATSPVITVLFQIPPHLQDNAEQELVDFLDRIGYENIDVLRIGFYPNTPSNLPVDQVDLGWYDQATEAQGIDGLHFVGEVFAGHGVPTAWLHAEDYVEEVFDLNPKEVKNPKKICYPLKGTGSSKKGKNPGGK